MLLVKDEHHRQSTAWVLGRGVCVLLVGERQYDDIGKGNSITGIQLNCPVNSTAIEIRSMSASIVDELITR